MWVLIICLPAVLALGTSSCVGMGPCESFCEEVKPKLLEQVPNVRDEDVQCSKAPYSKADTCDACMQIFEDAFDVSFTDPQELCVKHFGSL